MTYGLMVKKGSSEIVLSDDSIIGLSYIEEHNGTTGATVDLATLNGTVGNWSGYVPSTLSPTGDGRAYYATSTSAKQLSITDATLTKNNLFMSISASVTSLTGVIMEPWAMLGYYCIYDQAKHYVYYGQGSGNVTCFFGATK